MPEEVGRKARQARRHFVAGAELTEIFEGLVCLRDRGLALQREHCELTEARFFLVPIGNERHPGDQARSVDGHLEGAGLRERPEDRTFDRLVQQVAPVARRQIGQTAGGQLPIILPQVVQPTGALARLGSEVDLVEKAHHPLGRNQIAAISPADGPIAPLRHLPGLLPPAPMRGQDKLAADRSRASRRLGIVAETAVPTKEKRANGIDLQRVVDAEAVAPVVAAGEIRKGPHRQRRRNRSVERKKKAARDGDENQRGDDNSEPSRHRGHGEILPGTLSAASLRGGTSGPFFLLDPRSWKKDPDPGRQSAGCASTPPAGSELCDAASSSSASSRAGKEAYPG